MQEKHTKTDNNKRPAMSDCSATGAELRGRTPKQSAPRSARTKLCLSESLTLNIFYIDMHGLNLILLVMSNKKNKINNWPVMYLLILKIADLN